jgi:serine O-acetyltransferase
LKKIRFKRIFILPLSFWQKTFYGCEISPYAHIGTNFRLMHPLGVVIGQDARIGNNVRIWQQVTLGSHGKPGEKWAYPVVEDNVKIFAGAKIIGNVRIGKNSVIGANAVVIKDVPPDSVAVGVPAKVIKKQVSNNEFIS